MYSYLTALTDPPRCLTDHWRGTDMGRRDARVEAEMERKHGMVISEVDRLLNRPETQTPVSLSHMFWSVGNFHASAGV